jgi:DNA-binding response OmpR family regulator
VGARQATILVADDEPSIRLLCRVNLELDGHRVLEAATLDEARAALDQNDVDVLLIDVRLGKHDGRVLVRELREQGLELPVALLTGSVALSRTERAGADELIEKPFALEELTEVVRRLAFRAAPSHE